MNYYFSRLSAEAEANRIRAEREEKERVKEERLELRRKIKVIKVSFFKNSPECGLRPPSGSLRLPFVQYNIDTNGKTGFPALAWSVSGILNS